MVISALLTDSVDYKKNPYATQITYDVINNAIWYNSLNGIRYYSLQQKKNILYRK